MKILQLFNQYRSLLGGEETVVRNTEALLNRHGHQTSLLMKSSRELDRSLSGKCKAFLSGVYNRSVSDEVLKHLRATRPDLVHAHNLYPLFSPSVLVACHRAGVPVVMSSHNYMLTCPTVEHLHDGQVCTKCLGGKEYWCVLQNCRGSMAESIAYAARSAVARTMRLFRDHVTTHIVLSTFAKERLVKAGFERERIEVLPNMVGDAAQPEPCGGEYVAYSGRMSPEKGVDILLCAAAKATDIPLRLAGDGPLLDQLIASAPCNARFVRRLPPSEMSAFYQAARFLVIPSVWFEGCPLVVSEAMMRGLPVIGSRIGGLPELIHDGITGFLFTPGNASELAEKIVLLWKSPDLCKQMGSAGRAKAIREYGEDAYYARLMSIYEKAIVHRTGSLTFAT